MEVFQCRLCPSVLFETYPHAATHLRARHSLRVRGGNNRGSTCHEQLKPLEFRTVSINLSRVDGTKKVIRSGNGYEDDPSLDHQPKSSPSSDRKTPRGPRQSKHTVQKTKGGGVEIKLDSLKASEIETLMRDLYQNQGTKNVISSGQNSISMTPNLSGKRHQRRAAAANQVISNFGQDEDQPDKDDTEEPPNVKKRTSARFEDGDYRPYKDPRPHQGDDEKDTRKPRHSSSRGIQAKKSRRRYFSRDEDDDNIIPDVAVSTTSEESTARFHCRICPNLTFEVARRTEYVDHMKTAHSQDNVYPCSHCDREFSGIIRLNRHLDQFNNFKRKYVYEKKFHCTACPRKFIFKKELEKHLQLHERRENDPNKKFKCPICRVNFVRKNSMQTHFILHLENNPFVCKLTGCGAKFGSAEHLSRHVVLHSGLRPYSCESCDRKFARVDSLQKHVTKIHGDSDRARKNRRHRRRVRFPTFVKSINDLAPDTYLGLSRPGVSDDSSPSQIVIPKEEQEEIRWEVESQHFIDHVITNCDIEDKIPTDITRKEQDQPTTSSTVLHPEPPKTTNDIVKSKSLSNSNSSSDLYNPDEDDGSENETDNKLNTELVIMPQSDGLRRGSSIREMILSDPVYLKLLQDDPAGAESVVPLSDRHSKGYNAPRQTFQCTQCAYTAARSFFLHRHMITRHNINANLICNKNNPNTATGSQEPGQGTEDAILLHCGTCGYQSKSAAELSAHIKQEHEPEKKWPCGICGIRFISLQKKVLHQKNMHYTERRYPCAKCSTKCLTKSALRTHNRKKHEPKSEEKLAKSRCKICGKQLGSVLSLKVHIASHTNANRVACKICDQICANAVSLKRHIAYVHLNIENPYNKSLKRKMPSDSSTKNPVEDEISKNSAPVNATADIVAPNSEESKNPSSPSVEATSNEMIIGL